MSIAGGHGYLAGGFVEADGPDEFRKLARQQLRAGADSVKIMATGGIGTRRDGIWSVQLTADEIRAVTEVVHQAGTYVAAHATGPEGVIIAVENGVDCIEHGFALNERAVEAMATHDTARRHQDVAPVAIRDEGRPGGTARGR